MPSIRISKELTSGIYYLTFTVRNWYYIFDRHNRFQILADSLKY
jgi:putative transposase